MSKVGFILPSSEYLYDPFRGDPHTHLQILTVLDDYFKQKIDTSLIDLRGIKKNFAINHIPEKDIYLYSVFTLDYHENESIVKSLRERYPKSLHVAGGPHVSSFKEESLKIFDSIVLGDGEESVKKIIEDVEKNQLKQVYVQEEEINLDNYPYPSRHYLPKSATVRKNMMNVRAKKQYDEMPGTTAIFSRGCPGNCHFCAIPEMRKYNPRIRTKNPKLIEDEIEYLKKDYGIKVINILDEVGIPPGRRAIPYLEAIGKTNVYWRAQFRAQGVPLDVIKLAKDSGCISLGFGIESVSQDVSNIINKKLDLNKAKETIKNLKENDIEARIYLILGLPGEPADIEKRTWDFIKETEPGMVFLSLFTARPGTEVYMNPEKFGIKSIDHDWDNSRHLHGRYDTEIPKLNFEYSDTTPFGKSRSADEIVKGYLELQQKIKEGGYGPT